jgi:hypothetical protein
VVWDYTPVQAYAFAELAGGRMKGERGQLLSMFSMAVRGDVKELKKLIKELSAE